MISKIEHKEKFFILALFVIAFALRLGFTLYAKQHYFFYAHPSADVTYYQEWAREIATQDFIGKKAFFGLPLYPYFLAILYRLALGNIEVVRLFHLLLGSLNCLLVFFTAKKIFSLRAAILSGIFAAFNFSLIYYDWLMMPVTLIITLSMIIILAIADRKRFSAIHHWIILGLLMGLAILGDGKFLFFTILSAGWLWIIEPSRRKQAIVLLITALVVLGLCALRNKIVGGDFVLISAQSGLSFYAGNNPDATGTYSNPQFIRPTHKGQDEDQKIIAEAVVNRSMTPGEISAFWKNKAKDFIIHHPGAFINLLAKKTFLFFTETENAHDMDLLFLRQWKNTWDWNPLFILFPVAIVGMTVSRRKWRQNSFILILIFCQLIVTVIFFLATRHRATIIPFLLMFESAAVFWFIKQFQRQRFFKILYAIAYILIFAIIYHPIAMDPAIIDYNRFAKAGTIFDKRGDLENAKINYYKALEFNPYDSNTLYNIGNVYFQENDLLNAKYFYENALKVCSFNVDAIFNLGYVYEQLGQEDVALDYYKKVNHYQPDIPDVYFRMANIYAKKGQCPQAIPLYYKVVQLNPLLKEHIKPYITQCPYTEDSVKNP